MAKKTKAPTAALNSEISIEQRETEGLSLGTIVRRRFFHHKAAVASLIVLGLIALLAFTSVGIVVGGSGKLVANQETGRLIVDGLRIEGWWKYNWYENYPILNAGGTPTLSIWPFQIG